MIDITVRRILNETDKEPLLLYTEWDSNHFSIILFRSQMVPLSGMMTSKEIGYFSTELSVSRNKYLKDTKSAFLGSNAEILFYLKDQMFEWKKKNILTLGRIAVTAISEIHVLTETFQKVLEYHQGMKDRLAVLEKDNEILSNIKVRLTADIEEMIRIKNSMEKELYRKFLLVLNAKKQKIRELQDALQQKERTVKRDPVFDASTDLSEESEEDKGKLYKKKVKDTKRKSPAGKRKLNETDGNSAKSRKSDGNNHNINLSPKPSTSRNFADEVTSVQEIAHPQSSEESECELELKDADSFEVTKASTSRINFTEEESEEDLFSE